jgi:hypothetical protein
VGSLGLLAKEPARHGEDITGQNTGGTLVVEAF